MADAAAAMPPGFLTLAAPSGKADPA